MNFRYAYSTREDSFSPVTLKRREQARLDEVERENQRNAEYWRNKNIMELAEKLKREEFIEKARKIIDGETPNKSHEQVQQDEINQKMAELNTQSEEPTKESVGSTSSN